MTELNQHGEVNVSRSSDRQQLLWAGNTIFDVVLGGRDSGSRVALLDQWGSRGDVTPLHVHRHEVEVFYVLEGGVTAWVGDEATDLEAGDAVYLPPGGVHALGIRTDRARLITVTAPAGFADFVRAAGMPVAGEAPSTWEFDVGHIMAAAPAHDIEIVGPPPTLPSR